MAYAYAAASISVVLDSSLNLMKFHYLAYFNEHSYYDVIDAHLHFSII